MGRDLHSSLLLCIRQRTSPALPRRLLLVSTVPPDTSTHGDTPIRKNTIACLMSGADGKSSKRSRKNYPGEVSFDAQKRSKDGEGSVAHISLCTDMGTGAGSEDDAEPQFLGSLDDEPGEGSSVQQPAEDEFGEIAFLLGELHDYCIQTPTDAAVALLEHAEYSPQNILDKLFLQKVHRHSTMYKTVVS